MDLKRCDRCKKIYTNGEDLVGIALYMPRMAYSKPPIIDLCPECTTAVQLFIDSPLYEADEAAQ